MTRYPTCVRALVTLSILLTGVSASEAAVFGRWRDCNDYYYSYYYPACSQVTVSTPLPAAGQPAVSTPLPVAGQPAVSTAGPAPHTAMMPVIGENAGSTVAPIPQSGFYVPAQRAYPSSGWSTTPRSSWDYGSFPPYH